MPSIPGDQLTEKIRGVDPSILNILVSGWERRTSCKQLRHFDLHMLKPIENLEELHQMIGDALRIRERRHRTTG
ncbi:TPA: hypothetical protein DCE37_18560 [Candidatus Latescibacteria bacterium]|nr:hypothetical protein [Candidatus Latescibacterota bacterium]